MTILYGIDLTKLAKKHSDINFFQLFSGMNFFFKIDEEDFFMGQDWKALKDYESAYEFKKQIQECICDTLSSKGIDILNIKFINKEII